MDQNKAAHCLDNIKNYIDSLEAEVEKLKELIIIQNELLLVYRKKLKLD